VRPWATRLYIFYHRISAYVIEIRDPIRSLATVLTQCSLVRPSRVRRPVALRWAVRGLKASTSENFTLSHDPPSPLPSRRARGDSSKLFTVLQYSVAANPPPRPLCSMPIVTLIRVSYRDHLVGLMNWYHGRIGMTSLE